MNLSLYTMMVLASTGALGITAVASTLVSAVAGATIGAGIVISLVVDHFEAGRRLKKGVNDGLDAWQCKFKNMKTIGDALPGYLETTTAE